MAKEINAQGNVVSKTIGRRSSRAVDAIDRARVRGARFPRGDPRGLNAPQSLSLSERAASSRSVFERAFAMVRDAESWCLHQELSILRMGGGGPAAVSRRRADSDGGDGRGAVSHRENRTERKLPAHDSPTPMPWLLGWGGQARRQEPALYDGTTIRTGGTKAKPNQTGTLILRFILDKGA